LKGVRAAHVTGRRAERGEGERERFAEIALPLMDTVYNAALYLSRNPDDAADLLQDTFLRAYRGWHQFTVGTNCKAWLLTILHNSFRNRYRAGGRESASVEFDEELHGRIDASSVDPPDELVAAQVLDGEVDAALRQLPPAFLSAVVLIDLQELTYEEAATVVGCPIGTIRSRLSRGRQLLHNSLRRYAKERGIIR
jgi:RNA polymerase sigma-70 factor (ECF subfamily)